MAAPNQQNQQNAAGASVPPGRSTSVPSSGAPGQFAPNSQTASTSALPTGASMSATAGGSNRGNSSSSLNVTLNSAPVTSNAPAGLPHAPSAAGAGSSSGQFQPQAQQRSDSMLGSHAPRSSAINVGAESLSDAVGALRISDEEKKKRYLQQSSQSQSSRREPKQAISYAAERVIGNGSFGVVYQATVIETGETVAIKKVLQDKRFKNRELQIMGMLDHPDVVTLKHCFYSKGEKPDDVYLNLVMEYIPETIHRTLRNHTKAKKLIPIMYTKVYMYQICRSIAYIHSLGICHRDIKPQNLLLNTRTHDVKLCDFGSAKMLVKGEPNVSYICSRYYRAPELVFEATDYTSTIDIWSLGCVMAELLLGTPLFPGDSGVDQLIEIIKILGTPSKEEIQAMNPNHTSFKFPQIKPHPWNKVFRNKAPANAVDLVAQFLKYDPKARLDPFDALAHPFFDELREANARLPNGKPLPNLFNFTDSEYRMMSERGMTKKLLPAEVLKKAITDKKVPAPK